MPTWKYIREHEVTDERWFWSRRSVIQSALALGLAPNAIAADILRSEGGQGKDDAPSWLSEKIKRAIPETDPLRQSEEPAPFEIVSGYNNFYEFGTDKRDPATESGSFEPWPWSIQVEGEVEKPGIFALEDLIRPHQIEERIYRLRCVEAWSMVIPWLGIPLRSLLINCGQRVRRNLLGLRRYCAPARCLASGLSFPRLITRMLKGSEWMKPCIR